ncbi:hypothetical protein [Paenibacillus planticolens]|uniref:Uncharacterized protein n=1 Tax=Paenibacillus planticolens TaxID=2654976 RepID=A0ABX1ZHH7_9BACL|nr:hypothetical protein [Paenibacillus planticolens]NOU98504.1 hypothetical protein [Paenibacillus planticolens]
MWLIIVILLLIFFAPVLGISLTYGFGIILMLSIPILLVLCGVALLILWPINKYFNNPDNELKYQAWLILYLLKAMRREDEKMALLQLKSPMLSFNTLMNTAHLKTALHICRSHRCRSRPCLKACVRMILGASLTGDVSETFLGSSKKRG